MEEILFYVQIEYEEPEMKLSLSKNNQFLNQVLLDIT